MISLAKSISRKWIRYLLSLRFLKFAAVGASGTFINLGMLYLGQEHLFVTIHSAGMRLNLSLALAIFCATLNNFTWNRAWTWGDRNRGKRRRLVHQFGKYVLACGLSIVLQALLTRLLALYFYYLLANAAAIALAGILNFVVNDWWTFGYLTRWIPGSSRQTAQKTAPSVSPETAVNEVR